MQQREYQLTGDAPHRERDEHIAKFRSSHDKKSEPSSERNDSSSKKDGPSSEREKQIDKFRYSFDKKPDEPNNADVVEFVPVDFEPREGDQGPKLVKEEKVVASESVGKITDAEVGAAAQLAFDGGESGRINKLNFSPVDLSAGGENKTGLVQQILSNAIPALELMPEGGMFFNSTDEFISFVPVEVTRRKEKGGIRRQRLKSEKMSGREEELMKLLIAVEKMNAAETRATIIARNREKRRRRKERREKLKLERLKRQWRRKKENSVLPPDGFHASNSQKNFMKKKYYSRWVRVGDSFASQRFPELDPMIIAMSITIVITIFLIITIIIAHDTIREPQRLTPLPLPEEKKSSLYSQILASYK